MSSIRTTDDQHNLIVDDPKIINAWCMYDWANSAYSLIITTTFFPIYYSKVAEQPDGSDLVNVFGWVLSSKVLFSWMLSFAFGLMALLSPILSGIADSTGRKKLFMGLFCLIGSMACVSLVGFTSDTFQWGVLAFVLATMGYTGSIVFYNSFLPEIASPDQMDTVSAKGFARGYVGSLILQVVCLVPVLMPEMFGITAGLALRLSFLSVGLWWGLWSLIPLFGLPPDRKPAIQKQDQHWLLSGFRELGKVWQQAKTERPLFRFLISFLFYNMGVQTIMYLATLFGDQELHLASHKLIITIILLQVVAIFGARIFAAISARRGNILTLQIIICIWLVVCAWAYFVMDEYGFYGVASLVGLVMGGVQSLSRSTYAKLLPPTEDHASFFSFYDVVEKVSIVGGTFVFGAVLDWTGSMRSSILFLALFFVIGGLLLQRVKAVTKTPTN